MNESRGICITAERGQHLLVQVPPVGRGKRGLDCTALKVVGEGNRVVLNPKETLACTISELLVGRLDDLVDERSLDPSRHNGDEINNPSGPG